VCLVALVSGSVASADVFGPGPGGTIPDATTSFTGPGTFTSVIPVGGTIPGLSSLTSVTLTFPTLTTGETTRHSWAGDIQAILTAPNGDNVHLFSKVGATTATSFGDSSDLAGTYTFINTVTAPTFEQAATTALSTAPIAPGTYQRSTNALAGATVGVDNDDYTVFNGDNLNGNWTLTLKDWGAGDTGDLVNWSMDIFVPEPSSLALLGLGGLALLRRRHA
jgi:hypothetical protein